MAFFLFRFYDIYMEYAVVGGWGWRLANTTLQEHQQRPLASKLQIGVRDHFFSVQMV